MDFFSGIKDWFGSKPQWNPQLAKTHLKLAMSRMKLQINKKQNANSAFRREAAQLLKEGKEPQARLTVENIIRQENINKALAQLDVICEHILARFDALNMTSHPPPDLHGAICSVIFACPRVDIQELRQISQNFELKYGKDFIAEAMANKYNTVNEKILDSLAMARPQQILVDAYLLEIAKQNNIQWEPDDIAAANDALRQLRPDLVPPADSDDIPEEIPEPALDDVMKDEDLLRELDQIKAPKQQDLMQMDEDGGDEDIPDDIPAPDFGLPSPPVHYTVPPQKQQPPKHQQPRQTPPKPTTAAAPSRSVKSPPAASKPAAPVESDDFDLDLPEVPVSPPKPHFPSGGGDGGGLDDLDNLLPQVPPTDPLNSVTKSSKTNFGAGSGFGSSMASMARKPPTSGSGSGSTKPNNSSSSTSSPPPSSDSSALDDDELMARFRRLRDSN